MIVQPVREVDYRDAERKLRAWLKEHSMGMRKCAEWNRWHYGDRPFWSVWGVVYSKGRGFFSDYCGLQIYDDGEVIIFSTHRDMEEAA